MGNAEISMKKETAQQELWRSGILPWRNGVANTLCSMFVIVVIALLIIIIRRYFMNECIENTKNNKILHNLGSTYDSIGIQYH